MTHFADQLADAVRRCGNAVCVGLDPRWENLPPILRDREYMKESMAEAFERFCADIIEVVAPLVPVVKLQAAFFEELGASGMSAMANVIGEARAAGLLVVVDGKRNDIGSTAEAYARGFLGLESAWGADALTVSPYLGDDSLEPFVKTAVERGAGVFVLVKTSNPGGGFLQDLVAGGKPIYQHVAAHVEKLAAATAGNCGYGAVGAVVGATYPAQLVELRKAMPHTWFLVPGFGSQGGTATDVAGAFDSNGLGAIINNSRGIIFAHERPEFIERFGPERPQEAIQAATRQMIEELRAVVPRT